MDQWDWERVMPEEERTVDYLKKIVERIYGAILRTEFHICASTKSHPTVLVTSVRERGTYTVAPSQQNFLLFFFF